MSGEIGPRVRESIQSLDPAPTHKEVAARVGMTPDAFSRSVNGSRSFSSVELADVAEVLGADLHWLITGAPDPNRVAVAARHLYTDGRWSNPGQSRDQLELDNITLAYRQVFAAEEDFAGPQLPSTPGAVREALGEDFVRYFVGRVEAELRIDVVRTPSVSTTYSLTFGPHRVIALQATPNWFHENWAIAHELGHLALGHLDESSRTGSYHRNEKSANAFAAELLMPADEIRALDWATITPPEIADQVWDLGISTAALLNRLKFLKIEVPERVEELLQLKTQRLLASHWRDASKVPDQVAWRMDASATRTFPSRLREAHHDAVDAGRLGPETLAWMLSVDPRTFEEDLPKRVEDISDADLHSALGI
ncbi:ImmA/IrrE family metallo-endopeptidase [Rhodococcus sp. RS1C4]|uniref:helix-turn-helix domain-containing protein n=1 Tax=Rhodococcus sp. 114MFTsu3.1 TaxID=1172184 RepID=UPI00047F2EA3|nr:MULTISPECIES: XRE family transcriptional regulator [unclassified Rhodococcus (in: high G+C Gram-positive bacteria)]OZC53193.1 ImmA/IrrE family metallo-endopeptidase [Rhodococcus sp. RS1C4]